MCGNKGVRGERGYRARQPAGRSGFESCRTLLICVYEYETYYS